MKNLVWMCVIALIFSTTGIASDIAFYVGAPNVDGWYDADTMNADVETIIAESGPDALAGVSCARSINEDSYQMQKLFRAVFKTNNIDHCART